MRGGEDNITAVVLRLGTRNDEDTEPGRPPIVILPATALAIEENRAQTTAPPRRRGSGLLIAGVAAAIGILLAVAIAVGLQWAHFIGATPGGRVAIYEGLPFELTSSITLYRAVTITDIPTAVLSQEQRQSLLDQRIGSRASAEERIALLITAAPWLRMPPSTP